MPAPLETAAQPGRASMADDVGVTPAADVDMTAITRFIEEMARVPHPAVVELGTRRQPGQERTRHSVWVPHAASYVGVDYEPGEDVDVVADAHELSRRLGRDSVDAVVACSVFEHIKYPWIAAAEIAKVLRPGGLAFIHTHQTFAIHAHPHDYWRFSAEGLAALFPATLGLEILACHYQYPCRIVTADDPLQAQNPSYLNVCLVARKVGPSPEAFVPDLSR
jgi:SAM-dependent methyltransferase